MNHTSPSGSPTDKSGFGGCQENATTVPTVEFGEGGSLVPVKGNVNTTAYNYILDDCASNFVAIIWGRCFPVSA